MNCTFSVVQAQAFPADSLYALIRAHNAYSIGANWDSITPAYANTLRIAAMREDSIQAIVDVFAALDDVHSTLTIGDRTYGHYHAVDAATFEKLNPLIQLQRAHQNLLFDTILPNNIAYIRIPTLNVWDEDIDLYAEKIQSRLCKVLAQDVAGCIVDLRLNGGGNMYPMLAGLYPLLGNATVLQTTYPDSSLQYSWLLKKGNLFARNASGEEVAVTHIDASCKPKWEKLKVMVLVGPATMSSGQATAAAFLNRPYTLLIGEPTAEGYITAKNYYSVADGITLNMSSGFIRERNGEIFTRTLNPQLWVLGGDNYQNLSADIKVVMSGIQIMKTDW